MWPPKIFELPDVVLNTKEVEIGDQVEEELPLRDPKKLIEDISGIEGGRYIPGNITLQAGIYPNMPLSRREVFTPDHRGNLPVGDFMWERDDGLRAELNLEVDLIGNVAFALLQCDIFKEPHVRDMSFDLRAIKAYGPLPLAVNLAYYQLEIFRVRYRRRINPFYPDFPFDKLENFGVASAQARKYYYHMLGIEPNPEAKNTSAVHYRSIREAVENPVLGDLIYRKS